VNLRVKRGQMFVYSQSKKWFVPGKGWMDTAAALQSGVKSFKEFREFKNPNDAIAHANTSDDLVAVGSKSRLHGR
jgi:hypothetical protein